MPVHCTFTLNRKDTSTLVCEGYGTVEAYSGQMDGRDNPDRVATPKIGPIPPGTYYIVDRESGGMLGAVYDTVGPLMHVTTDHRSWFSLWNPRTGDTTMIDGVRRGNFRLHPEGPHRVSEGCITLVNPAEFESLQRFIRRSPARLPVPGSNLKAYGWIEVK
ncbi:DUF2778 domain-containing protein [Paraburkholderia azotifigens]|uniref:DUF2778 domain-containing protein n=1 Tax=Paraburkholderia azotifigens TaxID=2057004 RepID=A0A5C6VBI9_9BURK|nr:DUF2778 domain-containing protein [Paraburkholderia azotifigens]TXC82703.1 DUF2778 domain-containing protein [Paraburkholderia azotifigens]